MGVHVLLRRSMGRDIFAACGQLNSTHKEQDAKMDISNSKLAGLPKTKREVLAANALEFAARNAAANAADYDSETV
ncbi:Dual-specificity RNA methyltransferase RlmN [compost metagenome]